MRWERGERGGEESGGEQREEKESAHMAKINRKGVYWLSTIVQGRRGRGMRDPAAQVVHRRHTCGRRRRGTTGAPCLRNWA